MKGCAAGEVCDYPGHEGENLYTVIPLDEQEQWIKVDGLHWHRTVCRGCLGNCVGTVLDTFAHRVRVRIASGT